MNIKKTIVWKVSVIILVFLLALYLFIDAIQPNRFKYNVSTINLSFKDAVQTLIKKDSEDALMKLFFNKEIKVRHSYNTKFKGDDYRGLKGYPESFKRVEILKANYILIVKNNQSQIYILDNNGFVKDTIPNKTLANIGLYFYEASINVSN